MVAGVRLTRRQALAGMLGAGTAVGLSAAFGLRSSATPVGAGAVSAAEAARARSGRIRTVALTAQPSQVDLGGRVVQTWTYGGELPGRPIRVGVGDRLKVDFRNKLPQPTSVHWHGLAIRNDMDGVPGLVTPEVPAGGGFNFDFVVPDSGTYWFHPHTGLQLDRGLYAPFIVDDPADRGGYDAEWIVVLDDWTDGVGPSPEQAYATLRSGAMAGMDHGGMAGMGGGGMNGMNGNGDVAYPLYLVNGRAPNAPATFTAKPRQRVRLRIINAAADTIFDVALGGHALRVTHTDGYPVLPVPTPAVRIGMGERYDVVVTTGDGVFPLVASPVGKTGLARALLRTGGGRPPGPAYRPRELGGQPLTVDALRVAPASALAARSSDSVQNVVLAGSMAPYVWTINGRTYAETKPLTVRQGQATRLRIQNASMMPHPVHVHGHTFQLGAAGGPGPRKDTVLVPAMAAVEADLVADNPGRWMVHCHNAYHAEAGMMTRLDYVS